MSVRIGFIGAGTIANTHFRCLASIPEAEVVGVFDIDRGVAETAAARFSGCRVYERADQLIDSSDIDALYMCVPPFAHDDYESAAADRGLHLFVEKPVNISSDAARRVAKRISASDVVNASGYCWRYHPLVDRAMKMIGESPILLMRGHWCGADIGLVPNWWPVRAQSGGQIVEQTTHIVDLTRYFAGDVTSVHALASKGVGRLLHRAYDIDDASVVALEFSKGVVATITSTAIGPANHELDARGCGLDIFTPDLILQLSWSGLRVLLPGRTEDYVENVHPHLHVLADRAFIDAIVTGDRTHIRSTYEDAVETLEITLAANTSIETGQVVALHADSVAGDS